MRPSMTVVFGRPVDSFWIFVSSGRAVLMDRRFDSAIFSKIFGFVAR